MAIQNEFYRERGDGVKLYRTYSDAGFKIRQVATGFLYDDAIDVEGTSHTYEETDVAIPTNDDNPDSVSKERASNSHSELA